MTDIVGILKGDVGWGCSANSEEELACAGGSCKCERQIKQAAADEIERLREALCGIIEADCEAIQMGNGIVNLKPGPYAVIARIALGEKE